MRGFGASVYLQYPDSTVEQVSPDSGLFYQASISPDGEDVVFYGGWHGFPRLWHARVGIGGRPATLTTGESGARHPSFDWDGERIAFASDRDSPVCGETIEEINSATRQVKSGVQMHIYTCAIDGSTVRRMTSGPFVDHRPAFSPDGEWIAFASNRSGDTGIWRVPVDGSEDPSPVFNRHWAYRPWYTADGDSILFYGPDGDRHRIWKLDITSGLVQPLLEDDCGQTHGPFVSPGSPHRVLTHSTRGGEWGIWEFPLVGPSEAPRLLTPDGIALAAHPSRSEDGVLAFDVPRSGM